MQKGGDPAYYKNRPYSEAALPGAEVLLLASRAFATYAPSAMTKASGPATEA